MAFAHAPAVEQYRVSGLVTGVCAVLHGARQINARHHGEFANDWHFAGNGQAVFVVQGGVANAHGHITLGQLCFIHRFEGGAVAGVVFLDHDSVEHENFLWGLKI